ncbi:hypothetical protein Egran_03970 [Elaphomyces granulatus]|uniref:Sacsin/Nov domain-containing protein n=1 Tax=Elaphomyces granulatus TaxID=519963 RepID=A0A232LVQ9_9EURO|nr:hypothetical protein Egran_03970 [Elaphomyces granulatus]
MAQKIDFNALKARTLGSGNDEEAVTVDTRGLISKVLSRYSGKWYVLHLTILREMIQNAADASATRVTVKFETLPSTTVPLPSSTDPSTLIKHVISNHTLKRLLISNDGYPFTEKDWARLKRIADGNPDETKIGAFGVGFYSVFDDCEEPFVSSGGEAMAFYWKGNALFTRRTKLGDADFNLDTTFVLDYRNNSSPVPALTQLSQFLASSLTFVGLESIELWLDEWSLLRLKKKIAPSVNIDLPKDIETKTDEGLMRVLGVTREVAQVDATWMHAIEWNPASVVSRLDAYRDTTNSLRSFFSKFTGSVSDTEKHGKLAKTESSSETEDLTTMCTATVFLHINTASLQASISHSLSSELERATRKPPPKQTTLAILTPSYDAGMPTAISNVLASVLPSGSGRVFIGFPTHQTTGLNAHISAPSVIPTVERESIDLNTRYISKWNLAILRAAGIVCRIAWSAEMASINAKILSSGERQSKAKTRKPDILGLIPEAIHTANQFAFRESTPSSQLGRTIEDSFWMCNKSASIEVLSTCGVMPTHEVRIAPKELSFMDGIPVLPDDFVSKAGDFVKKLTDFGLVTDITVSDIKRELERSALTSAQLGEFLKWLGRKANEGELDRPTVKSLLNVAIAQDEPDSDVPSRLIVMAGITTYLNPAHIPADLPLPLSVMPFKYTKALEKRELDALGWEELQIVPWIQWLVDNAGSRNVLPQQKDLTQAPSFAGQILSVLSKQWDSLNPNSKQIVTDLLHSQTVIPTNGGMKRPAEAYFSSVRLFDDLPVVPHLNGVKEKFLVALGVRKTVELGVIFGRLLSDTESVDKSGSPRRKWSHVDLIKYLASVKDDIPPSDIVKLRDAKFCTPEPEPTNSGQQTRYKVSELFEPKESLRKLGLPMILWPVKFQLNSTEGKFLTMLGLRSYPSALELIEIMAKAAAENNNLVHTKAMSYFIAEHHSNGYAKFDSSKVTLAFLPVEGPKQLSSPSSCFTDDGATLFGFDILKRDLHPHAQKFSVREHPPVSECISFLTKRPPVTTKEARSLFSYMARRIGELGRIEGDRLGQARIVPILNKPVAETGAPVHHVEPRHCYLGQSEDYGEIFDFVDFGQEANLFLLAVGAQREPTKVEVASILVRDGARISSKFQSADKYLNLLRSLAENLPVLKRNRELFNEMKKAPFLLASKELPSQPKGTALKMWHTIFDEEEDAFEEDGHGSREWQLVAAKDAVIVDDFLSFTHFKEHILAAPQEEFLESLYAALGSPFLSNIVEEKAQWGAMASDQRPAEKLLKLIKERIRLFLHDQASESIKHDIKWLEKYLSVQVVHSIFLKRSLKNRRAYHTQKRNAIVTQQMNGWTLLICPNAYDLYEISQALVHLVLVRPKLHSTLTLEMLLKTDLFELKARGYNVQRILRRKAAEAKMAEDQRQKQLAEDRRHLKEKETEWLKSQQHHSDQQNAQALMPGVFPNSPSNNADQQQPILHEPVQFGPRNLFSNLTKRLGLDDGGKNHLGPPPPYSANGPQNQNTNDPTPVTSPHALQKNLLSAIQSSRPHGSTGIYSRPVTNQVTETKSYCDEQPSHDLAFAATLSSGMNVLIARSTSDQSAFLAANSAGLNTFSSLLTECASVFALRVDSVSIFYDPFGKTIAFNRGGSILCNYLYFSQLHQTKLLQNPAEGRADALVYWWVIMCHELAHNLVEAHSSDHSYYTEGFVTQYFPKLVQKLSGTPS